MIILIDNYDSFSYNLYQLAGSLYPDIRVVRNDAYTAEELESMNPEAILISPGPGRPEDAGVSIDAIRHFAGKVPTPRSLPGPPGHLQMLRRHRILRQGTGPRQSLRRDTGHREPPLP